MTKNLLEGKDRAVDARQHVVQLRTTKLVFVFAPVFSLGLAAIASGIAWFVARVTDSQ
jgi:hypothetical protein